MSDQDLARKSIARHAENFFDEHQLNDMLGLLADPEPLTEFWVVTCLDPYCKSCHNPVKGGGEMVEAPADWDDEVVLTKLFSLEYVCQTGHPYEEAAGLVETMTHLLIPDIKL